MRSPRVRKTARFSDMRRWSLRTRDPGQSHELGQMGLETVQHSSPGQGRIARGLDDRLDDPVTVRRREPPLVHKKLVGRLRRDLQGIKDLGREVPNVGRHDAPSTAITPEHPVGWRLRESQQNIADRDRVKSIRVEKCDEPHPPSSVPVQPPCSCASRVMSFRTLRRF